MDDDTRASNDENQMYIKTRALPEIVFKAFKKFFD